tara:strand:+ start:3360 stop:6554 length:3195 start_codon:yes stop_codon:yes gene_type:complete
MADYDPRGLYPLKENQADLVDALSYKEVCSSVMDSYSNNALESVSIYQTVDAICEGEVAGLCDKHGNLIKLTSDPDLNEDGFKGIYLNDVPVKNTDVNSLNYNRVFADFRTGTGRQTSLAKFQNPALSFSNAVQAINFNVNLPGLSEANKFIDRSVELLVIGDDRNEFNLATKIDDRPKSLGYYDNFVVYAKNTDTVNKIRKAEKAAVITCVHTVSNDSVDSVQIEMAVPSLLHKADRPAGVAFVIKIGYVDDELTIDEGGSVIYTICSIMGETTAGYNRSHLFPLPRSGKEKRDRFVKIFRVDQEKSVTDAETQKGLSVATISEIVQQNLTYPHTTLMGMIFDARAFSQPPTRRFDLKLTKVFVPSNYNVETKNYNGNWDGEFKPVKEWTDNPAWIFYDIATNERYGIGKFGFKSQYVDKWNLYSIAKYCDAFVPTGYSGKYSNLDFDCTAGSVTVNVSAPSSDTSGDNMIERFPRGGTICLFSTKDSDSTDLDKAFKRLIFYEKEDLLANYSSNKLKIKLVKIPDPEEVFEKYPDIKTLFLEQQKTNIENSYDYLVNYLKTHTGNDSDFASDYLSGEPLDLDVRSGKASTQFFGYKQLLEPRFRCNIFLDERQEAYNVLNDIAAIFRGMIYWSSGYISASNDQARDAVMLFTNSNVADGQFVYSGSAATSRTTAVTVRFNDENDSYKPKVEYLEDPAGLREYGYVEKEVVALGITSRGQAHRLAKWMLYTNQTETDTVQFTTGQEGSYLRPGDVVKIQDKLKTSKRYGGRIVDIDYGAKSITLDEGIQENIVGQKITVIVPRANKTVRELNQSAKSQLKIAVENGVSPEGIPTSDVDASREPQIKQFTIASVSETNVITITETTDEDFNSVLKGYVWSVQNTSSEYEIEEVEYRIVGVTEQNFAQYQVTGMMYNRSKFAAVDESKSVENTQQSLSTVVQVGSLPEALTGDGTEVSVGDLVILQPNVAVPHFDGKFSDIQQNNENYYVEVDFQELANQNGVNFENTGGYIVEVTKASGDKVRFSLSGHDQTRANILVGDVKNKNDLTVEIYRFDPSFKLNVGL